MLRFSRYTIVYIIISAAVLVPGLIALARFGLVPAIDFTGGTLLEVQFDMPVEVSAIEEETAILEIETEYIQQSDGNTYLLRMKPIDEALSASLLEALSERTDAAVTVLRNETVGPTLGSELLRKTVTAALLAVIVILSYVAYSFRSVLYGISAVVALLHDLLVVVGSFALLGYFLGVEVDALFVTAVLTTMSFSVHDTIVVFDRIRELSRKQPRMNFADRADLALTETMNRSLVNSLTIIFMLLALVLMGGETIRWFVAALLIGTVSGTYSSPFVATPVLIALQKRFEK